MPVPGPHAFPKSVRLRKRREFLQLQRQGQRRHSRSFVIIQVPGRTGTSRLGVTVSSRVGNAVVRNRIKRLVREIFRNRRPDLSAIVDVVVIAKPDAAQINHAQATFELERALAVAAHP